MCLSFARVNWVPLASSRPVIGLRDSPPSAEALFEAPRAPARPRADAHLRRGSVPRHHFGQNGMAVHRLEHLVTDGRRGRGGALAAVAADAGLRGRAVLFADVRRQGMEQTLPSRSCSGFDVLRPRWILGLIGDGALRSAQAPASAVVLSPGRAFLAVLRWVGLHADPAVHAQPPLLLGVVFQDHAGHWELDVFFHVRPRQEPAFIRNHFHGPFSERQRDPAAHRRFLRRGK